MHPQAFTAVSTILLTDRNPVNAANTPVHRKRRYSSMTRYLHTAQVSSHAGGMQYRVLCKSNRPGTLSRAPIQSPYAAQQGHKAPVLRAREGKWALMTANTTNWSGAQALITALGLPNNPSKPTFIVIQEHRNAGPDDCKQAEDWASNYGYNLSVAPAATTGRGKLQTSGGVAVGAQKHIGITKDMAFQQHFSKHRGRIHAVICNCLFPRGVLLVGAYWKDGLDMAMLSKLSI